MATETKRRGSFIIRVVLLIFAVWMFVYLSSLIKDLNSVSQELDLKLERKKELVYEVAEKARLLETGDDKEFIERAAREKLGYVYRNEKIFIDISGS